MIPVLSEADTDMLTGMYVSYFIRMCSYAKHQDLNENPSYLLER